MDLSANIKKERNASELKKPALKFDKLINENGGLHEGFLILWKALKFEPWTYSLINPEKELAEFNKLVLYPCFPQYIIETSLRLWARFVQQSFFFGFLKF